MTPEHVWELVAILAAGLVGWWSRRSGDREQDERKAREALGTRFGERIGALEKANDYREGYEEGRRAGLEEARKGHGG
jgi:hypothetical protein